MQTDTIQKSRKRHFDSIQRFGLNLLSKTSVKITITICIMFILLFVLLDFVVVRNSENTFVRILEPITIEPGYVIGGKSVPNRKYNILLYDEKTGQLRVKPLHEEFTDRFQHSLTIVLIIGIITSLFIGYTSSRFMIRPLRRLISGINDLKQNNYKIKIDYTGTIEFDKVIAEFNRLADELSRVEELRKDLISDTSHELKTPLTSLKAQLEAVRDGVLSMDTKRANTLLDQVERLDNLVESLQEFSRLRNKSVKLNISPVNIKDILENLLELKHDELEKNHIKVLLEIKKDLILLCDREKVERVFENLLSNALKYSGGNQVLIIANKNKIQFMDNGIGIPQENISYIFERFYRVEKSRNRKTGGLGLGLSIVKEIVESHGWEITVKSPADNYQKGTEFDIFLKSNFGTTF